MPKKYTLEKLRKIAKERGVNSIGLDEKQLCNILGINCQLLDSDSILDAAIHPSVENINEYRKLKREKYEIDNKNNFQISNVVMR